MPESLLVPMLGNPLTIFFRFFWTVSLHSKYMLICKSYFDGFV